MATVKPNEASEEFGLQRRRQSIPKAKRESTYSVYMCLCLTGHVRPVPACALSTVYIHAHAWSRETGPA